MIATYLKAVVWVSKGMHPVKYFCSNKSSFFRVIFLHYQIVTMLS